MIVPVHPSALHDGCLPGWRGVLLQVMNRAGVVTGKVWFNFRRDRLHGACRAEKNFIDRQRIKRRALNRGRRCEALPAAERLAARAAMVAVEAE